MCFGATAAPRKSQLFLRSEIEMLHICLSSLVNRVELWTSCFNLGWFPPSHHLCSLPLRGHLLPSASWWQLSFKSDWGHRLQGRAASELTAGIRAGRSFRFTEGMHYWPLPTHYFHWPCIIGKESRTGCPTLLAAALIFLQSVFIWSRPSSDMRVRRTKAWAR